VVVVAPRPVALASGNELVTKLPHVSCGSNHLFV
jgi:hypothetical protein